MDIKELLKLAGNQGKVIILGEDGEVKGVFLSTDSYQSLVSSDNPKTPQSAPDITEKINREITKAQLEEPPATVSSVDQSSDNQPEVQTNYFSSPMHINSAISQRAQELFKSMPFGRIPTPSFDLREQVIDPNFDFNTENDSEDEEIKPQFEDI